MPPPAQYSEDPQHVVGFLDALHVTDPVAAHRIEDLLDLLAHDHTDVRVRERAWRPTGWGFTVHGPTGSYTTLWTLNEAGGQAKVFAAAIIKDR